MHVTIDFYLRSPLILEGHYIIRKAFVHSLADILVTVSMNYLNSEQKEEK